MAEPIPDEIEAKLLVNRPATLSAIGRLRSLGPYTLRPLPTQRLHTVYLDCAELVLTRHGMALRARQQGRRWEMTVKWQGEVDGEVHRRPELTVPLAGPIDGDFTLSDPELRRHLACYLVGRPLQVVLVSDIVRHRLAVVAANAGAEAPVLAEIALDRVYLHRAADEPQTRYCEVEIEAMAGDVDVVRATSAALHEAFELQPSAETKFGRGMQLLHGAQVLAVDPLQLRRDDNVAEAARKVVAAALQRLRAEDPHCRLGEDPEAVHAMRVAIRRLRAAMQVLEPGFAERWCDTTRSELRWLAAELGKVRDLDVHVERVVAFAEVAPPALRESVADLVARARARRPELQQGLVGVFDSSRYERLLLRLESFVAGQSGAPLVRSGGVAAGGVAARAIERAYRRVRRCGRGVGERPRPEELHELRIRTKRARYALELYAALAGKRARRAAKGLAKLQEHLGTYNDAIVGADFVQQYVAQHGESLSPAVLLGLGALIGAEMAMAQGLRSAFPRHWKRLSGKPFRRDIDAVVQALSDDGVDAGTLLDRAGRTEEV